MIVRISQEKLAEERKTEDRKMDVLSVTAYHGTSINSLTYSSIYIYIYIYILYTTV